MKTTKTKPQYKPATKQIATCLKCKNKYICWSNMKDYPICPYCGEKHRRDY